MSIIDIDMKTFSPTPFGRYKADGPKSGEVFRSMYLVQAFKDPNVERVVVHLDSVAPGYEYSSSFLEEVFGGLVRVEGISMATVHRKLEIDTEHEDYKIEIKNYIKRAADDRTSVLG